MTRRSSLIKSISLSEDKEHVVLIQSQLFCAHHTHVPDLITIYLELLKPIKGFLLFQLKRIRRS